MVCSRCKLVVRQEFEKLGLQPESVELGEISIEEVIPEETLALLKTNLSKLGFEWLNSKQSKIIEQIKTNIVSLVHEKDNQVQTNLSAFLASELNHDYSYLSNLFSEIEGTTIEQFYILQKIEKVKELLTYDELTLSEIAFRLNYSSAAHLSSQFKKVTGLPPSHYKQLGDKKRTPLENL